MNCNREQHSKTNVYGANPRSRIEKGFYRVYSTTYPLPGAVRWSLWFVLTLFWFDWRFARNMAAHLLEEVI
jgi:hypothetical protein